jgi:hypothetical protein
MRQPRGARAFPSAEPAPATVAGLARRVLEVYQGADDDLRHAVHDSLQAGLPRSVLLAEEQEALQAATATADDGRTAAG